MKMVYIQHLNECEQKTIKTEFYNEIVLHMYSNWIKVVSCSDSNLVNTVKYNNEMVKLVLSQYKAPGRLCL